MSKKINNVKIVVIDKIEIVNLNIHTRPAHTIDASHPDQTIDPSHENATDEMLENSHEN